MNALKQIYQNLQQGKRYGTYFAMTACGSTGTVHTSTGTITAAGPTGTRLRNSPGSWSISLRSRRSSSLRNIRCMTKQP